MGVEGVGQAPSPPALARLRHRWRTVRAVRRRYAESFGRPPSLLFPRRHSERIVRRKLFERDERMPPLADKIAVKQFVIDRAGPQYAVPTIWSGDMLPSRREMKAWPRPFVLKASHGSRMTIMVPAEGPVNWARIERKTRRWLDTTYGADVGEWLYSRIPPRLLVEPHLGDPSTRPDDYKLWVFHGRVHVINWARGRGSSEYGGRVMDRDWEEVFLNRSAPVAAVLPPRPATLDTLIWLAEQLAADFDFARVDLYDVAGQVLFGELTFYPMSGNLPLEPSEADLVLGRLWRRPRHPRYPAMPRPESPHLARAAQASDDATRLSVGGRL